MPKDLTVAEYMELVQAEGLLVKSMGGHIMTLDGAGSKIGADEEEEVPNEDGEMEEDEDQDDEDLEDEEKPTEFELTISTNEPDRINDVLNPMGCVTDNFAQNPLFLYEHGNTGFGPMSDPGAVLGQIKSLTQDPETKSIRVLAKYFPREGAKLVSHVLDLERKGLIPGNSMGWLPLGGIKLYDDGRRTVDKWELIEVSKVLVPINGSALRYYNKRAPNARIAD